MDYEAVSRKTTTGVPQLSVETEWEGLTPLPETQPVVQAFCREKQIRYESLQKIGTRYNVRKGGGIILAFPRYDTRGAVSEIRYRDLSDTDPEKSRWSKKANDARTLPMILGPPRAEDWAIVEGETDSLRLHELAGDSLAVLCLAGAQNANRDVLGGIPTGATVYAMTDDDIAGDRAAVKIKSVFPNAIRVSPEPAKDWCEWQGDRAKLVELVHEAKRHNEAGGIAISLSKMMRRLRNTIAEKGIQDCFGLVELKRGHLAMLGGYTGDGKSTLALQWAIDAARRGFKVLFFSLEMTQEDFKSRISGLVDESEEPELDIMFVFGNITDYKPHVEIWQPHLVFIDHIHHTTFDRKELAEIAKGCKDVATSCEVPIVVLAQLTEDRQASGAHRKPRPDDSRLRETAVLSHLADYTMYVYRKRDDDGAQMLDAEIYLDKKRHLPPGQATTVMVKLHPSVQKFVLRDDHKDDPDGEELSILGL